MTIIGAYLSEKMLREWTLTEAKQQLSQLQDYGINTIFSEADTYRWDIIEATHNMGMQFMGGLTCFHAHQSPPLDRHPILANGEPRPKMNWYTGIVPTHEDYNDARLASLGDMILGDDLDGVWLDFIRWSLHWEQELRADTPAPLESSFDLHTLQRFATFADLELPTGTTQEIADWIVKYHLDTWVKFKCAIITDFVTKAKAIMQAQSPHVKPLGIAVVPASPVERKRLLGQDVRELSQLADYISPMLYHHVLGKPATWIADKLDEIADESHVPLLPYLQVNAFGDDENFPTQEWETILDTVLTHQHTVGFIAFTGDGLHTNQRGQALQNVMNH